jgi:hypothetical protein
MSARSVAIVVARMASLIGCVVAGDGCKSSGKGREPLDAQQAADSGADAAADADAVPSSDLFTDPSVPRCAQSQSIDLRGSLDGRRIDDSTTTLASNLAASSFQVFELVGNDVRLDVVLTWDQPLAQGRAVPLTGLSFVMREGQPFAGESFCITAGDFGSPALAPGAAGRTFLYRITGARRGDCDGSEVPVALAGCVFRTDTYFPGGGDGGADGSGGDGGGGDGGVGLPMCGPDPVTDGAAPECNSVPIEGRKLTREPVTGGDAGPVPTPAGGVIVDGDYELVGYRTSVVDRSLRGRIRVTGGATRIEWASTMWLQNTSIDLRYNTRTRAEGTTLRFEAVECVSSNTVFDTKAYSYTANGDDLTFFYVLDDGTVNNIYTYRRLCRR